MEKNYKEAENALTNNLYDSEFYKDSLSWFYGKQLVEVIPVSGFIGRNGEQLFLPSVFCGDISHISSQLTGFDATIGVVAPDLSTDAVSLVSANNFMGSVKVNGVYRITNNSNVSIIFYTGYLIAIKR